MDRCQTFKLNLLKSKHCGLLSLEDGPPPLEWDGPPPLEWDGPPPLEWDGPPPLELNGPPPLEKDEPPPPLEFDDTSFLEIFYQAERQCHQSVEYRQNNVRTPIKQGYHHSLYQPHGHMYKSVVESQPMYIKVSSSTLYPNIEEMGSTEFDEPSCISNYERSYDHQVYTLVFVANFSYGTSQKEIMKLFEVYKPLDVRMIITAPSGTGEFTQALVLLPSPEDAEAAVMKLNNTIFKKRRIVVSTEARDIERACGCLVSGMGCLQILWKQ
ncbi:uncharacterized protein LOC111086165 isoform X2 [Limulus polyphemus]|uniref:Uncharacterized protein LOC111086165 isoform X2 n=1 Tax=Limulus polyphemus TaxID=6850 RepID=A0ABM1SIZ2_LIMPO|nr:uncharacterized protein LOC111086165 isoform X2 [Limulus polyphemus]